MEETNDYALKVWKYLDGLHPDECKACEGRPEAFYAAVRGYIELTGLVEFNSGRTALRKLGRVRHRSINNVILFQKK